MVKSIISFVSSCNDLRNAGMLYIVVLGATNALKGPSSLKLNSCLYREEWIGNE